MISPTEITLKAARLYLPFLRSWLQAERFFPLDFPVGKLPGDYLELRSAVRNLQAHSKEQLDYGYTIEYQVQQKRSSGTQTLPVRVMIETQQDFLRLINKVAEFASFQQDSTLIRAQLPALESWLTLNPHKVIDQHLIWPELLAVCHYFQEHPRPQLYIRELPINVHTKFIEQHRSTIRELLEQTLPPEHWEPLAHTFEQRFGLREKDQPVRLRLLDEQLFRRYNLPLTDLSCPASQFATLDFLRGQRCIITENEMTFLTLPAGHETFAIFGSGFMVNNLRSISWLADCPILYWGDLDAQGFQILSRLRSLLPHVISIMMDQQTFTAFSNYCVRSTPCPVQQLPWLTEAEHALFLYLAEHTLRLEQERISHTYALRQLATAESIASTFKAGHETYQEEH